MGREDLARSRRPDSLSRVPAALSCPANSRYELCAPACQASCNPDAAPSNCSARQCVEGCVCLEGFVESGGACVAASSCGCIYEGRPLAPGQEVWADTTCQRRCTCDAATGQVRCSDTQGCPEGRALPRPERPPRLLPRPLRNLQGVRGPALRELRWPTLRLHGHLHVPAGWLVRPGLRAANLPGPGGKRASGQPDRELHARRAGRGPRREGGGAPGVPWPSAGERGAPEAGWRGRNPP